MSTADELRLLCPVGLRELDERAGLMTRQDNKYLVPEPALWSLLRRLSSTHQVLQIAGQRSFAYQSVYFDTPCLALDQAHAQGRRIRWKARTRQYRDTGLTYQELKVKGTRGSTDKVRQRCAPNAHGRMTADFAAFLDSELQARAGRGVPPGLRPTAIISYERSTLVARSGQERVTIDRTLSVLDPDGQVHGHLRAGLALLEVKTALGRGAADTELRSRRHHPLALSKYGVAVALMRPAEARPALRPVLRRGFLRDPLTHSHLSYAETESAVA